MWAVQLRALAGDYSGKKRMKIFVVSLTPKVAGCCGTGRGRLTRKGSQRDGKSVLGRRKMGVIQERRAERRSAGAMVRDKGMLCDPIESKRKKAVKR